MSKLGLPYILLIELEGAIHSLIDGSKKIERVIFMATTPSSRVDFTSIKATVYALGSYR